MTPSNRSRSRPALPFAIAVLVVGCGDPSQHYDVAPPSGPGGEPAPARPGQPPEAGEPPEAGDPPVPAMEATTGCEPTAVAQEQHPFTPGEGVELSGKLVYEGTVGGPVLVEVMTVEDGEPTGTNYNFVCEGISTGPFEAEAPPRMGEVVLVAFVDGDGNGPSTGDPAGRTDVLEITDEPVSDLVLRLEDEPDLGPFAPGAAPAPATEPAPAEEGDAASGVVLSGSLHYEGEVEGPLVLDWVHEIAPGEARVKRTFPVGDTRQMSRKPQSTGPRSITFSALAPAAEGHAWLVAFVDEEGDGPDPDDPAGIVEGFALSEGEMKGGIEIVIEDEATWGELDYPFDAERPSPWRSTGPTAEPAE